MPIKRRKGWEIPESTATPESVFFARRRTVIGGIAGAAAIGAGAGLWMFSGRGATDATAAPQLAAATPPAEDPSANLYPATRNMRYRLDRELTDEKISTTYNNFYEFGSSKNVWQAAQKLNIRPWEIKMDGMVEKPRTVGIDDLLKVMKLEERLYRHRCVEAWAMAVPWTGFPMKDFVAYASPLSSAKYVRMETFMDAAVAPGQKAGWYPWPYIEGLTIDEATNELTLLATGIYGKPIPRQMGAPLRLVTPWKYGFKSIKSIVRFNFTDQRPKSFWEAIQASEYGFWANVNPKVPHPRWSQATEEVLGTNGSRVPTQLFNGYGDFVADLYTSRQNERLWA
jgi:methionine sulfoxide reductase catalytic subunit